VSFSANALAILYSVQFVTSDNDFYANSDYRLVMGGSVALYWVAAAQYLEYFPRFYLLIWTLKTGIPRVMQFFTGIAPFFIGYALLGMTLFGDQSDLFGSFSDTCCTLFSVVNGDSIHDVFKALAFSFPLGDIYLYIFIFLFMYVVLMSVIAIVEEAFFDSLRSQGIAARDPDHSEPLSWDGDTAPATKKKISSSHPDLASLTDPGGEGELDASSTNNFTSKMSMAATRGGDNFQSMGGGHTHTSPFGDSWSPSKKANPRRDGEGTGEGKVSFGLGDGARKESYTSRLMPPKLREVLRNIDAQKHSPPDSSSSDDDDNNDNDEDDDDDAADGNK